MFDFSHIVGKRLHNGCPPQSFTPILFAKANWPPHWDHGKNPKTHLNGHLGRKNHRLELRDTNFIYAENMYKYYIYFYNQFKWVLGVLPWSQCGGQFALANIVFGKWFSLKALIFLITRFQRHFYLAALAFPRWCNQHVTTTKLSLIPNTTF